MKKRNVDHLGWSLVGLGVLVLGFVVHQLFSAEPDQDSLTAERIEAWGSAEIAEVPVEEFVEDPTVPVASTTPTPATPTTSTIPPLLVEPEPEPGSPFALIRIPGLPELEGGWNIVAGVGREDLKAGIGHMPRTAYPGQPGNSVISGHRTTYGQPFHNLDLLEPGDSIEVETATGLHVYSVREIHIVEPDALWVALPRDGGWLTLTTCNPKYSADERLIIVAEIIDSPNLQAIQASY